MATTYAITVTLKPKCYKHDIDYQYRMLEDEMFALADKIEFDVIPELTTAYNVHAHGIVRLRKVSKRSEVCDLYAVFRKCHYIGFVMIKPITDKIEWSIYVHKDVDKSSNQFTEDVYRLHTVNYILPIYEFTLDESEVV